MKKILSKNNQHNLHLIWLLIDNFDEANTAIEKLTNSLLPIPSKKSTSKIKTNQKQRSKKLKSVDGI